MCNDQPTGGGVQSPPCSSYPDYSSPPCQECCMKEHSISCCGFWSMVYTFPYNNIQQVFDCGNVDNPTLAVPPAYQLSTAQMISIANVDPNSFAIYMFAGPNPDNSTNNDITVQAGKTFDPQFQGIFNQSIPLFQGLINKYPNGTYYFYKARYIDSQNQTNDNVTFYVSDGFQENYYCDVTVLFP